MATKLIRNLCYNLPAACIPEKRRINHTIASKSWTYQCDPLQLAVHCTHPNKNIRVSLQGADGWAGIVAAYILRQHPLISRVYMHSSEDMSHIAADLNCTDRNCRVEAFHKQEDIKFSLRAADIVMIMDVDKKSNNVESKFKKSVPRVVALTEKIRRNCPRAMIVVCVDPVCCMVPIVRHLIEDSPWFHPRHLVGSVTYVQTKINCVAAHFLKLDPTFLQIPLVGGPDLETVVPVVSLMQPYPGLSTRAEMKFYKYLKRKTTMVWDNLKQIRSPLNEGVAVANLAITIARGLCGQNNAWATAFANSYIWNREWYMVSTIRFGEYGVCENFGVPNLTTFEMQKLVTSLGILRSRNKLIKSVVKMQNPRIDLSRFANQI